MEATTDPLLTLRVIELTKKHFLVMSHGRFRLELIIGDGVFEM